MKQKKVPAVLVLQRFGPLLGLGILCAVLGVLSDHFLTFENLINVFRQSAVNALVALGQLVVIITAGIDLSVNVGSPESASDGVAGNGCRVAESR